MNKIRRYCLLLCIVLSVATLFAQTQAEYFIDNDPGVRRATKVSINASSAQIDVPTGGLAAGWHLLGVRALSNRASQTYTHRFFIPEQTQVTALSDVEYFVDTDPGRGSATKIPFTVGQTAFSFDLTDTDNLSDGIHLVGVRAKYGNCWSQTYTHLFFVSHASAATELTGVEYWLDTDPGLGKATAYEYTPGQTEFALEAAIPNELEEGTHLLGVRVKYGDRWSQTYTHQFLHTATHTVPVVVEAVEAYWDADMANPIEVPFNQVGDTAYIKNFDFDTKDLSFGLHYLYVRGKVSGVWSILSRYEICKNAVPAFEILNEDICVGDEVLILDMTSDVQPETTYKWDMDSNGSAEYTDKGDIVHTYTKAGKYTITLTVQTAEGCESSYSQEIYVHAKVAPSVSINRSKSSICAGETVTFTANATNAGEHPVFTWLRNGNAIEGQTEAVLELSDLADNDKIQVQVTGDNPCADVKTASSSTLTQRVYALPEVAITLASVYYTDQNAFSLSTFGTPSGGTFYINDEVAKLFNPKNNPTGTYSVRYVVTNSNNCTAEAEMTFQLKNRADETFAITFVNDDGTTISEAEYKYGTTPVAPDDPTKAEDAQYIYTFAGWSPEITTVTGQATYTATYTTEEKDPSVPTVPILSQWYDTENNVVLCVYFDVAPCNDVYLVGTCNNWGSGSGDTPDFANCQKFMPVPGYVGWYAVEFPYTDGTQGKPIQANSDGSFSWSNQCGDPDAWIRRGDSRTKFAWLEAGFDYEANIYFYSAGVYVYELAYWKHHVDICIPKTQYTINMYAPNPCDGMKPAIIGEFNSWSENVPLTLTADDQGREMYTCTISGYPGYEFKFREVNDNTWDNQLMYLEDGEWYDFSNFQVGEQTVLAYDFSDDSKFRYAQCVQEEYRYLITFQDEDGSVLSSELYQYGTKPVAPDAPTKAATAQYTYTFSGWDKSIAQVTQAVTYTATYSQTVNKYTITWLNDDDSLIDQTTVEYGVVPTHADPSKDATAEYNYTFTGWDKTPVAVTGDATYKATFSATKNKYTITWLDGDGNTLKTEQVAYGETPAYTGETPTMAATAQYTYAFNNTWSPAIEVVTGNATYTAQFTSTVREYTITVTAKGWNEQQSLPYGTDLAQIVQQLIAIYGNQHVATDSIYTLVGWSPELQIVTEDATYEALYTAEARKYTITWLDENGTVLDEQDVDYGQLPEYAGDVPTKEEDEQFTYTFSGWDPEVAAVTGEATYTATFTAVPKQPTAISNQQTTVGELPIKIIHNDVLYILRDGKTYTVQGQEVR